MVQEWNSWECGAWKTPIPTQAWESAGISQGMLEEQLWRSLESPAGILPESKCRLRGEARREEEGEEEEEERDEGARDCARNAVDERQLREKQDRSSRSHPHQIPAWSRQGDGTGARDDPKVWNSSGGSIPVGRDPVFLCSGGNVGSFQPNPDWEFPVFPFQSLFERQGMAHSGVLAGTEKPHVSLRKGIPRTKSVGEEKPGRIPWE